MQVRSVRSVLSGTCLLTLFAPKLLKITLNTLNPFFPHLQKYLGNKITCPKVISPDNLTLFRSHPKILAKLQHKFDHRGYFHWNHESKSKAHNESFNCFMKTTSILTFLFNLSPIKGLKIVYTILKNID